MSSSRMRVDRNLFQSEVPHNVWALRATHHAAGGPLHIEIHYCSVCEAAMYAAGR